MSGIIYRVAFNDLDVTKQLSALLDRISNRRGSYNNVGEILHQSAKDAFKDETGQDGKPWKKLRPGTIKARERKNQTPIRILSATNKVESLASLFASEASNDEVKVFPLGGRDYAAIHQLGGTINIPQRKGKVYRHLDPKTKLLGRKFVKPDKANHVTDVDIPAYTIVIPARPYLGISADDKARILEAAGELVSGLL